MYPAKPKVTITHTPSGISAYCNQCRTNRENHKKAMGLLRSRLWAAEQVEIQESDLTVNFYTPPKQEQSK